MNTFQNCALRNEWNTQRRAQTPTRVADAQKFSKSRSFGKLVEVGTLCDRISLQSPRSKRNDNDPSSRVDLGNQPRFLKKHARISAILVNHGEEDNCPTIHVTATSLRIFASCLKTLKGSCAVSSTVTCLLNSKLGLDSFTMS